MKIDFASLLNASQLEAVTTSAQHVRIIAGAGSGKTRVLTYRIAYLINEMGVDPSSILAVTFTNKAAREMKDRVEKLVPGSSSFLTVCTFHSFCARFLRKEAHHLGYPSSFTILDDDDSDKMIIDVLVGMGYKKKDPFVKVVKDYIGRKKTLGVGPDDIKLFGGRESFKDEKIAIEAYKQYEIEKYKMLALDFDDLLLKTREILRDYPEVRQKWAYRYYHILVDEFQDTNDVQYDLLMKLVTIDSSLYVVGDPDQTIYTWRGANQKLILSFPTTFPDYQDVVLNRNYRSTKHILDCANNLIAKNKMRVPKDLYTEGEEGPKVEAKAFESAEEEANWLSKEIERIVPRNEFGEKDYSKIAVLYRASYITRAIEQSFARNHIMYRIFGGLRFYQRKEVKDVLCYFRLFSNPKDDVAFDRIVNVPKRGIGETSQALLKEEASKLGLSEYEYALELSNHPESELPSRVINALTHLILSMEKTKKDLEDNLEVYSKVLKDFIKDIGYLEYIVEDQSIDEDRVANVNALFDDLNSFISENPSSTFEEYIQNISLLTSQDDMNGGNYVSLMTVHVAKGLEFDYVFIVSLNEGVFPSARAVADTSRGEGDSPMEEERRLAYVAITRAKKKLYMSTHSGYSYVTDSHSVPSPFFKEAGVEVHSNFQSSSYGGAFGGGSRYGNYGSSYGGYSARGGNTKKPVSKSFYGDGDSSYFGDFDTKPKPTVEASKIGQSKSNGISVWRVGDKVRHTKFGDGVVVEIVNSTIIIIDFEGEGKKTMLGSHPSITKISSSGGEA